MTFIDTDKYTNLRFFPPHHFLMLRYQQMADIAQLRLHLCRYCFQRKGSAFHKFLWQSECKINSVTDWILLTGDFIGADPSNFTVLCPLLTSSSGMMQPSYSMPFCKTCSNPEMSSAILLSGMIDQHLFIVLATASGDDREKFLDRQLMPHEAPSISQDQQNKISPVLVPSQVYVFEGLTRRNFWFS